MPEGRLLRGISGKQALAAFQRAGGVVSRTRGSHLTVKMLNGESITIPLHGEVRVGLLLSAIKRAGLTVEEFRRLL